MLGETSPFVFLPSQLHSAKKMGTHEQSLAVTPESVNRDFLANGEGNLWQLTGIRGSPCPDMAPDGCEPSNVSPRTRSKAPQ